MSTVIPWEQTIIEGSLPVKTLSCSTVGDIDGDGHAEVFVGGEGALFWYRPATGERGIISEGYFHVGSTLADIHGDGRLGLVCGQNMAPGSWPGEWTLVCFKPGDDLNDPWEKYVIDPHTDGGTHDVIFADVDGDGRCELLANACYTKTPGVFIYKPGDDPKAPWHKHAVQTGFIEEGLEVADLNGDGRVEIISGPDVYFCPEDGPYSGPWRRMIFAPSHREMCRLKPLDITGNGRADIVIVDSEYIEGQLSWFENRLVEDPEHPWVEHRIERGLKYAHSLEVRQKDGKSVIFSAEMAGGGWKAPYNYDARLIEYTTSDAGKTWDRRILDQGQGTHGAILFDIDGDGEEEIVTKEHRIPRVQIWKKPSKASPILDYRHRFIDRDKPGISIDILASDVDGDGRKDVVCGSWWYHNPTWRRYEIPDVFQVIHAYDIDGDGRDERIAIKPKPGSSGGYGSLCSTLVWLKAVDPLAGKWQEFPIGEGVGDWPHGSCVAPLLPGGKLALVTSYHSAHARGDEGKSDFPDIFEIPDDPTTGPWQRRTLAQITYGEQIVPCDITGNGTIDLIAGPWWLENLGDGNFKPHRIVEDESFYPARIGVLDVTGNGRPDIVMGPEAMDFTNKSVPFSPLAWFECPEDPRSEPWPMHVIDQVRCAHSIGVADLDGDGQKEIVCGEHDPFYPYRNRNRLFVYKQADSKGLSWKRYQLDDRFEHHDGAQIIELSPGRFGIISHGWKDSIYVHLWEPD
ncbi:MAG: VCBS repeat-containing protein [Phycisphaerae bacterium]|nr:VCBS repeat-containing protein [Phycisphaerae bacterium]